MGAFIEVTALVWSPSQELRALLAVGVLGAFTTFSAFSLEAVALTLVGVFAGMHPFRRVLS
jgi:CrcB protein